MADTLGSTQTRKSRRLSREKIVSEAGILIREDGARAFSIRRLAARLSVTPMAVYRHVRDRQDILMQVLAETISENDISAHDDDQWQNWLVETCVRMRKSLAERPEIMSIMSEINVITPSELRSFETVLTHLVSSGLTPKQAARVFHIAVSFTFGSLAFEQFKSRELSTVSSVTGEASAADFPLVEQAAHYLYRPQTAKEFAADLERIICTFFPVQTLPQKNRRF